MAGSELFGSFQYTARVQPQLSSQGPEPSLLRGSRESFTDVSAWSDHGPLGARPGVLQGYRYQTITSQMRRFFASPMIRRNRRNVNATTSVRIIRLRPHVSNARFGKVTWSGGEVDSHELSMIGAFA